MLNFTALRKFLALTCLLGAWAPTGHLIAQPAGSSVLEQLEANEEPSRGKNGKVETDVRPADVIHWELAGHDFDPKTRKMSVTLLLSTERQFTIYQDKLKLQPSDGWKIASKSSPQTVRQFDPISRKDVDVYTGGPFDLVLEATGKPETSTIAVTYVGCTQVICLFPHTETIEIPWRPETQESSQSTASAPISTGTATASTPAQSTVTPQASTPVSSDIVPSQSLEEKFAQQVKTGAMSLGMLLLIAFVGGLLTNLTPCVAPMIPITIRLLAHQTVRPLTSSMMYALGIIATYTVLGVIAALSGALFGTLIAHPAVSITFGLVMLVLGLNMLGFGDLSRLQQIGGQIGSSKGGALNAFMMGAGAGLVASPCTGPILAALLTYTAGRQNTFEAISLLGTYSAGFALPYVFLGASAARLSKVRVSFHVQILTKLVFASVMFALSLYFLRIPLYGLFTQLRPYWNALGIAGVLLGLGLSALIILRPSFHHRKEAFLAPTIALGIGLFFGIQTLTRGSDAKTGKIEWYHNESEAFEASKRENKPILVDAWAEWCEACKKMDVTTFVDLDIINETNSNWIALKFDLTEINDDNSAIQDRYELQGLPTLTLLPPGGDLKRKQAIAGYSTAPSLLDAMRKFHGANAGNQ